MFFLGCLVASRSTGFTENGRFALVDTSQSRLLLVVINRSLVVHICMSGLVDCSDNVRLCVGGMDAHLV